MIFVYASIILVVSIALFGVELSKKAKEKDNNRYENVIIYYPNADFVETGDDSNGKLFSKMDTIECNDSNIAIRVGEKIMEYYKNKHSKDNVLIEFNSIEIRDKDVYVDINKVCSGCSLMQEDLIVDIIVSTFTTLDNIDSVQFLVNGESVNSLFGHVDTQLSFNNNYN